MRVGRTGPSGHRGLADDTRARLLSAARDLVLESGPANASLREVARRVGVSAPAVYRHFENKEALVLAACEQGFQIFSSYLVRALSEPTPSLRLRAAGTHYLQFGLENPRDYQFIFMSPAVTSKPAARTKAASQRRDTTFQFLVDRVNECMQTGVLKRGDSDGVAATIWAHVHGLVSLRLSGHLRPVGDEEAFAKFYRHSVDEVLRGLAP